MAERHLLLRAQRTQQRRRTAHMPFDDAITGVHVSHAQHHLFVVCDRFGGGEQHDGEPAPRGRTGPFE